MSEQLKYGTATFQFKGKMFCYFSIRKKTQKLYIGFVNGFRISHPLLMSEGRKQIKVFYIDPNGDVDIKSLNAILELALKT